MIIWDLIKIKSLFYTCFLITNIRKPIMIPNNKMFTKTSIFLFGWDGPLNDENLSNISCIQKCYQTIVIVTQSKVASLDIFVYKRNKTNKFYSLQTLLNAFMIHRKYYRTPWVKKYTTLSKSRYNRILIQYPYSNVETPSRTYDKG